jgi:hypothetical protein
VWPDVFTICAFCSVPFPLPYRIAPLPDLLAHDTSMLLSAFCVVHTIIHTARRRLGVSGGTSRCCCRAGRRSSGSTAPDDEVGDAVVVHAAAATGTPLPPFEERDVAERAVAVASQARLSNRSCRDDVHAAAAVDVEQREAARPLPML